MLFKTVNQKFSAKRSEKEGETQGVKAGTRFIGTGQTQQGANFWHVRLLQSSKRTRLFYTHKNDDPPPQKKKHPKKNTHHTHTHQQNTHTPQNTVQNL